MSFNWHSFQELSRHLKDLPVDKSIEEARNRTIVSRSYYCVYNIAKITLQEKKKLNFNKICTDQASRSVSPIEKSRIPRPESHWQIITILKSANSSGNNFIIQNLGQRLESLKERREDADYRLDDYKNIASRRQDFGSNEAFFEAEELLKDFGSIEWDSVTFNL
jgi:hypothetical protein